MSSNKFTGLNLISLPDCTALAENARCSRLNYLVCENNNCPFKSSFDEEKDTMRQVFNRLASLEMSKQEYIAKKYYKGNMPWNQEKQIINLEVKDGKTKIS